MGARQTFRTFMKVTLFNMRYEGKLDLSDEDIEKFVYGIEDDPTFHDKLDDFLNEYIEDFGENYDLGN